MKEELHPKLCKKIVYSGERWDIGGHQCGNKPFKDGLCKRHQPDAVETRRAKTESAQTARFNSRMRSATHEAHAPILAAALRAIMHQARASGDDSIVYLARKALDSYERDLKRYEN